MSGTASISWRVKKQIRGHPVSVRLEEDVHARLGGQPLPPEDVRDALEDRVRLDVGLQVYVSAALGTELDDPFDRLGELVDGRREALAVQSSPRSASRLVVSRAARGRRTRPPRPRTRRCNPVDLLLERRLLLPPPSCSMPHIDWKTRSSIARTPALGHLPRQQRPAARRVLVEALVGTHDLVVRGSAARTPRTRPWTRAGPAALPMQWWIPSRTRCAAWACDRSRARSGFCVPALVRFAGVTQPHVTALGNGLPVDLHLARGDPGEAGDRRLPANQLLDGRGEARAARARARRSGSSANR